MFIRQCEGVEDLTSTGNKTILKYVSGE